MGKGNQIKRILSRLGSELLANDLGQFGLGKELMDREFTYWNDQFRFENRDLSMEPTHALGNFHGIRDAIPSDGGLAGETAADGCHVNGFTEVFLLDAAGGLEPLKEGLACRPGEGTSENRLFNPRGLPHEYHFAEHRASGDHGLMHFRTTLTGQEISNMPIQDFLGRLHWELRLLGIMGGPSPG